MSPQPGLAIPQHIFPIETNWLFLEGKILKIDIWMTCISIHLVWTLNFKTLLSGERKKFNPLSEKADDSWTSLDLPNKPPPMSKQSSAVVGSSLYIFGGLSESGALNELYCFNFTAWTLITPSSFKPPRLHSHSLTYVPDTSSLYIFGGYSETTGVSNLMYQYKIGLLFYGSPNTLLKKDFDLLLFLFWFFRRKSLGKNSLCAPFASFFDGAFGQLSPRKQNDLFSRRAQVGFLCILFDESFFYLLLASFQKVLFLWILWGQGFAFLWH